MVSTHGRYIIRGTALDKVGDRYIIVECPRVTLPISVSLLATDSSKVYAALAQNGVDLFTSASKRKFLSLCEGNEPLPSTEFIVASEPGWRNAHTYVLQSGIYSASKKTVLQCISNSARTHKWQPKGSLQQWQNMAKMCCDQTKLAFMLYTAFVPPLLGLMKVPNFSIMYFGNAGRGKSTAGLVAGSVWGGDENCDIGFGESLKATLCGVEGYIREHSGACLFLDETKLYSSDYSVLAKGLVSILMDITSGMPKVKSGSEDKTSGSRLVGFITSNHTLAEICDNGKYPHDASYNARLFDIPVDNPNYVDGRNAEGVLLGILDSIPDGFETSEEVIAWLRGKSSRYYGTASATFVERLVRDRAANHKKTEDLD